MLTYITATPEAQLKNKADYHAVKSHLPLTGALKCPNTEADH